MKESLQPSKNISSTTKLKELKEWNLRAIAARDEVNSILRDVGIIEEFPEVKALLELNQEEAEVVVIKLFKRFYIIAITLKNRRQKKPPFEIEDEYGVQDLLEALLRIYFHDVRPEEPTPSIAGSFSRIDFILKRQKIGIEAKMAIGDHANNDIKKEITLDKDYYRRNTDCTKLLCLVYDPTHKIKNAFGFEDDLSDNISGLETKVFVIPKP
jgi:hypothetical protein